MSDDERIPWPAADGVQVVSLDRLTIDDLLLLDEAVSDIMNRYGEERDNGLTFRQEDIDRAIHLRERLGGRIDDLSITTTGRPFGG